MNVSSAILDTSKFEFCEHVGVEMQTFFFSLFIHETKQLALTFARSDMTTALLGLLRTSKPKLVT